jgi:hypothetical protein
MGLLPILTASRYFLTAATSTACMQKVGKRQFRIEQLRKGSGEAKVRGARADEDGASLRG